VCPPLADGGGSDGSDWSGGSIRERATVPERKHLSPADVARAGGWSTTVTLQRCYEQPDEETMLRVTVGAGEVRERKA